MINKKLELMMGGYLETYIMNSEIDYEKFRRRPAMIICPGGAYTIHATKESEAVAISFMEKGYQCFILKYSVAIERKDPKRKISKNAKYPVQVLQLMEAIHIVKKYAVEWNICDTDVYVLGFSAGGHVCASVGTRWNDPSLIKLLPFSPCKKDLKPKAIILGYPMLSYNSKEFIESQKVDYLNENAREMNEILYGCLVPNQEQKEIINLVNFVSKDTVPVFLWHTVDDAVVDVKNSHAFIDALLANEIVCEFHMFSYGNHGRSLANHLVTWNEKEEDAYLSIWIELANQWIKKQRVEVKYEKRR